MHATTLTPAAKSIQQHFADWINAQPQDLEVVMLSQESMPIPLNDPGLIALRQQFLDDLPGLIASESAQLAPAQAIL